MSTLNESVSNVRLLLDNPFEQKPTVRQIFGSLIREYANFYNELSNSSVAWTVKEHSVALNGQTDYLISGDTGKILFVTGEANTYPYPVDFTDLADASAYWWSEYPFTAARPEDYNFAAFPGRVAFYRKNGSLYMRSPNNFSGETLTITVSTGDWASNISSEESAVLSNHHHLPEIRAAMNLCHSAKWTDDDAKDVSHYERLVQSLGIQEQRAYQNFVIAKRSMTADEVCFIGTNDGYF